MIWRRGLEWSKSRILLEDKVTVLILTLFKLLPIMLEEELSGKIMYLWEGLILLEGVLMAVRDRFLGWILRALDLAKCIKLLE